MKLLGYDALINCRVFFRLAERNVVMVTAVVLIKAETDKVSELAQQLAELEGVSEVFSVAGQYDLVALVRVKENEDLALVISEVIMPRVDGFTLAKILRGNPNMKRVPIMFMSARNEPKDVTQALVLGVAHYFKKPTSPSTIVEKIRKVVV